MDKREAMRNCLSGHKVRQVTWEEHEYIYFDGDRFRDEDECYVNLDTFPTAVHWELYVVKKHVSVMMAPVILCTQGKFSISQELFRSEEELINSEFKYQFVRLMMDTHAVEVMVYE